MSTLGINLDYRSHKYFSQKNSKVSVDFSFVSIALIISFQSFQAIGLLFI